MPYGAHFLVLILYNVNSKHGLKKYCKTDAYKNSPSFFKNKGWNEKSKGRNKRTGWSDLFVGGLIFNLLLHLPDVQGFAVALVVHVLALADDGILGMAGEGAARGVEPPLLQLALHVLRRTELQALLRRVVAYLIHILVGVATLTLRDIDNGEGAERVDGHARLTGLTQLITYLVEHGGQHGLDRGLADAAAPDDGGGELLEVLLG